MDIPIVEKNICPKYRNTNEPLEAIVRRLPIAGQRIFSVLGSGVFPLEFLRRGAERVVTVDNSDEQLFWSRLYFVSVEHLSYDEFRRVFLNMRGKKVLSDKGCYRRAISEAFGEEFAAKAHETIASSPYIERENLTYSTPNSNILVELWHACFPKYYQWVRSKKEYEKVQDGIKKRKLVVLKGEIPRGLDQFADNSFDVAYLSNVIEWLEMEGNPRLRSLAVDTTRIQLARILSPWGIAYLRRSNYISPLRENWKELFDVTEQKEGGYLLTKRG